MTNPPDDKILARLKNWNCEWLSRPNIAMSEMASTLKDNWDQISRFKGTVFTTSFVNQLEGFYPPIMPALRRLDNKDRYCHDAPDKDDILDVIEAVHKDEKTEALFMEAFTACGPVLMMAIHIIAFNCLLHNLEALAEQSVKNVATNALRTNPTKQNVNQYLIDSILQKRRTVQRSTENLWDRSLYSAGTDSPAKQKEQPRRRRLDTHDEDDATPGTSGSSTTLRRRLCSLPDLAKPPTSPETTRGKRVPKQTRKRPSLSPVREHDDEDEATQLYTRALPERRARTAAKRRAAVKLPTTFDDEEEEVQQRPPQKNKRPLEGPPTAKNRRTRDVQETRSSDSDDQDQQPIRKTTADPKSAHPKHRKRPPTVVSSESDLDDDQLGITPRTPPESPFYRGHRNKGTAAKTTKTTEPSTSKRNTADGTTTLKEQPRNPKRAETTVEPPTKKKKTKKPRGGLEDLVQEQDKLYADLNKMARKSK
ncbi:unnamed protein product [Porites evermanni]|uniref:Uncharacterized protein n=1 Tax=Porites evermanni TaxID=104178 RepID=A0ABN8M7U1_9CNID|nr:unnamed protein product [Porites evermanni]